MKKTMAMFLALLLLVGGCAQNASVESSPEGFLYDRGEHRAGEQHGFGSRRRSAE